VALQSAAHAAHTGRVTREFRIRSTFNHLYTKYAIIIIYYIHNTTAVTATVVISYYSGLGFSGETITIQVRFSLLILIYCMCVCVCDVTIRALYLRLYKHVKSLTVFYNTTEKRDLSANYFTVRHT